MLDAHLHAHHDPHADYPPHGTYFNCAIEPEEISVMGDLVQRLPGLINFGGLHPVQYSKKSEVLGTSESLFKTSLSLTDNLVKEIRNKTICGIGEIGLDRRPAFAKTLPEQMVVFEKQLIIAQDYHLPVAIHCVRSIGHCIKVLEKIKPKTPLLLHGWTGHQETAKSLLRFPVFFGLGLGSQWTREKFLGMVKRLPRDRILLETDWPYTNVSSQLPYSQVLELIYQIAAQHLEIDKEELVSIILSNGKVFTDCPAHRE